MAPPPPPSLRRLHPGLAGEEVTIEAAYSRSAPPSPADRPWVMVTMIASLDGATVIDGTSAGLGNEHDRAILSATRALADVIVVGAGTVRAEGYGRPKRPALRIAVVTRSGHVDTSSELFTSGAGFLVMPEDGPSSDVETLRAGTGEVDLPAAMRRLHELAGPVDVVQVEGGPRLNAALLAAGCVDELNLTISPTLAGSGGPGIVAPILPSATAVELPARLELSQLLLDDDCYLFTRWRVRR